MIQEVAQQPTDAKADVLVEAVQSPRCRRTCCQAAAA